VADGKVKGHHLISVIRQTCRPDPRADALRLGAAASARVPVADGSECSRRLAGQAGSVAAQAKDVVRLDCPGSNAVAGLPGELQDV